jgi:hypothetical protein
VTSVRPRLEGAEPVVSSQPPSRTAPGGAWTGWSTRREPMEALTNASVVDA